MSYDSDFPPTNALLVSAQFRTQFQGLKTLIDEVVSIIAAQVDGVTTGLPSDPATVALSVVGNTLHFTFAIPKGNEGAQGIQGTDGGVGPQGPPFAQVMVDAVNTLLPGENATVSVSFDGTNVHLTIGIPRGQEGVQGPPGIDGAPGEVTNAALATAISTAVGGTSNNTNAIATLDTPFPDPDAESMRLRFNELVLALRR